MNRSRWRPATLSCIAFLLLVCPIACGAAITGEQEQSQEEAVKEAKLQAKELLERVVRLLGAAEAKNAVALAEVLGTDHRPLEKLSLIKLRLIGLPEEQTENYKRASVARDQQSLARSKEMILTWAREFNKDKRGEIAANISSSQAMNTLLPIWNQMIRYGNATEKDVKELALILVGMAELFEHREEKARIANRILLLIDRDEIREELDIGKGFLVTPDRSEETLGNLCDWLSANMSYLYFHPEERTLKIDQEARSRKAPSLDYRKKHPWGRNSGPNKTDASKKPIM